MAVVVTGHDVVAVAPVDLVVTALPNQRVVAGAPRDEVVAVQARWCVSPVGSGAAVAADVVVPVVPEQDVATAHAVDLIVVGATVDGVVGPTGVDLVVAG